MSWLKFVTEHIIWTEEQWDCVHFSNESKFNRFGSNRRRFVRRSPKELYSPQCSKSIVEFGGGSVTVFGMICCWYRTSCQAAQQLYTKRYRRNILYLILRTAINEPAVFMQDNAPCQTAKTVQTFPFDEDVTVREWPAQSPDVDPIENVWKLLD